MDGEELIETTFPTPAFIKELTTLVYKHAIQLKFGLPAEIVSSAMVGMLVSLYVHTLNVKTNDTPTPERQREINGN